MNIDVQTTDDDPNLIHDVIVTITFRPVYSAEEKTLTLGVNQTGTLTVTP
jgi:nitrogen fixation protein FixH